MDEDELMAELGELGDEDDDGEDPSKEEEELLGKIDKLKKLALKEKKAGNKEKAVAFMKQMKHEQEELDILYQMHPKLKKAAEQRQSQAKSAPAKQP
mmetsp:Transcript_45771/g.33472  ORF Transcript_45771/g.33472 Transcript_45771/m.33472 type:complete len:97 (+) Transcript_45771:167-457(+)